MDTKQDSILCWGLLDLHLKVPFLSRVVVMSHSVQARNLMLYQTMCGCRDMHIKIQIQCPNLPRRCFEWAGMSTQNSVNAVS